MEHEMKKPKITEGEWYHQKIENPNWDKRDTSHYVGSKTGHVICDLIADEFTPACKANARATSAVPEMIDALIAIKSVLNKDSVFVGFEMGAGKDDYHFAMDKIEQALKKAGCTE